jgi:hypothetical protein
MTKPPCLAKKDLSPVNRVIDDLVGADVHEANVRRHADLLQTNLSGADRTDADLNEANLGGRRLRKTIATGATLKGADLREGNRVTAELASVELDPTTSGSTHSPRPLLTRDAAGAWHRGRSDPSASREHVPAGPSSAEAPSVLVWEGEGGRCEPSDD